jgi:5-methylcytosine-specific restriction endonuclease McrA
MRSLDRTYRERLVTIARLLQERLLNQVQDSRIRSSAIKAHRSTTYGWYCDVLRIKRVPGSLQLWLDLFPNIGRPVLSISYTNGDLRRVSKVAEAFTHQKHAKPDLRGKDIGRKENGQQALARPLPKSWFGKPLLEAYQTNFFTVYLPHSVSRNRKNLESRALILSKQIVRAMASILESEASTSDDYPAFEDRRVVASHVRRERSSRLARMAKTRDGFTCQVCQFNFAERYGELGRGFAEAHHKTQLSKLKDGIPTRLADLITVCSNCHRILHKMDGSRKDIVKLRRRIRFHPKAK